MRRILISATSTLMLSVSPMSGPVATFTAASGAAVLALPGLAWAQDLDAANAAVRQAEEALEAAKASGEGVKEARQALKDARAQLKRIEKEQKAAERDRQRQEAEAAEKQKQQEAEAKAAEEEKQRQEAAKAAEEEKQRQEAAKAAEEEKQRQEAAKAAEEEKQRQEAAKAAEEEKQRQKAAEAAEEEKQRQEAAEAAEEEKQRQEAEAAEEEKQRQEAEAAEQEKQQPTDAATTEQSGSEKAAGSADETDETDNKAERRDRRKQREQTADSEPPTPSPDAPEAKPIAEAPIEQQIEEAAEKPAAVIPDDVTREQRERLEAAERERREDARRQRQQLLGAAGAAAVIGALVPALGGRVVDDEGDRLVVERDGRYYVRKDESALMRDYGRNVQIERLPNGRTREIITRPNGTRIITVRDAGGYALRRIKVRPDGRRIVLFDYREDRQRQVVNYDRVLPPLRLRIPRDQYIVSGGRYGRSGLADILMAPPVEELTSTYSLRDVRENDRLRSMVRRIDLDNITFDTGSATVRASQVPYLANIAGGMLDVIDENPAAVFLIEGHTDAVGDEIYNLTLSDRRAETVARILVEAFDVPPENLVVEGYGEQYLKIDTLGDERRNRRVAIRNITPLLTASEQ
jgi:outer membrane protein OmpA-like peptidoglycan-associated protein